MPSGQVIRAHGGVHYVQVGERVVECRPRGRFRLERQDVLAGDWVEVALLADDEGRIDGVLPRRSVLARPPVANVDQALVVCSLVEPELDRRFLDRVLCHIHFAGIAGAIGLNKVDLAAAAAVVAFAEEYRRCGYEVYPVSARTGSGLAALARWLADKVTVLAGQSGVGKSHLAASLLGREVRTGEVSVRTHRGRHTTRHVELMPIAQGGLLVDAPGFTHLEFTGMSPADLTAAFPELQRRAGGCRFDDCRHRAEPDCAVKAAVAAGEIPALRYQHYLDFRAEVEALRKW